MFKRVRAPCGRCRRRGRSHQRGRGRPRTEAAAAGTTEYVYSAAMGRNVPVRIISGGGGAAKPTLYLLDGLRAPTTTAAGSSTPTSTAGHGRQGCQRRHPVRWRRLLHTDWQTTDPKLGKNKWKPSSPVNCPAT